MNIPCHLMQGLLVGFVRIKIEFKILLSKNSQLRSENYQLRSENSQLCRRSKLDSSNSSKPPSSDGLSKKPAQKRTSSTREKGLKPNGGQKGHKGSTLKQVDNPDRVIRHSLDQCPKCSKNLRSISIESISKRQVFDIPEPKIFVTEHQSEVKRCPCCMNKVSAEFPYSINSPAHYGSGIQTLSVYLLHYQLIPEKRVKALFEDLFKLRISTATIVDIGKKFSQIVEPIQVRVLENLKKAPVKHLDETGFRIGGKTHWLHVVSNILGTHYRNSVKRKNLLEGVKGIIIHDHWKPYFSMKEVQHALCNAHHLRELKAVLEIDKEPWAGNMSRILRVIRKMSKKAMNFKRIERIEAIYDQIVSQGLKYHEDQPPLEKKGSRGPPKRRKGHNLVIRLRDFKVEVLRCFKESEVPFTNNQAEQDIRMMKVKQKISGGFRTEKGSKTFCNIRGFLSTCRKQGFNLFESIKQTLSEIPPEFSFP